MRTLRQWLAFNFLMLLVLCAQLSAYGQELAAAKPDVTPAPAISLEVLVLGVPSSGLRELGLFFPESGPDAPGSPMGFAIVLPEGEAQSMAANSRTVTVHKLKLDATPGDPARFRVDARTPSSSSPNDSAPIESYFEVGLRFEVTSSAATNHSIALSTQSMVQIRRGPGLAGGLAALLLETEPLKNQVQVPEGKTILLGGFFTDADSSRLPSIPLIPDSPILRYVLSKGPRQGDDLEIVVLLTPRLTGAFPAGASATTVSASDVANIPQGPSPEMPAKLVVPATAPPVAAPRVVVVPAVPASTIAAPKPVVSPAPAAEAAPQRAASNPRLSFYAVQVGAFQNRTNADALVEQLKQQFDGAFVDQVATGRTPYHVRIGNLPNLAAAKQVRRRLLEQGFDSFVVLPDSR